MAGLDGQDGTSGGEVVLAHDFGSGTKVGGHTDTLEHCGSSNEALHILVAEVVGALADGLDTGFVQCGGQESNVGLLVGGDGLELGVDIAGETGLAEVVGRVLLQSLAVEGILEMLESESVVEDIS